MCMDDLEAAFFIWDAGKSCYCPGGLASEWFRELLFGRKGEPSSKGVQSHVTKSTKKSSTAE